MPTDALTETEARSLHYAQEFGRALGALSIVAEFMQAAREYPEIRDDIMRRTETYVTGLLAEFAKG